MAEPETPIEIDEADQPVEPAHKPAKPAAGWKAHFERLKTWYLTQKKLSIPASVVVLLLILFAIPPTRYELAGTAVKHDLTVKVTDSTAGTPVSGASVSAGGVSAQTDGTGKATLKHLSAGNHQVAIAKKYYQNQTAKLLVPIFSQKTTPGVQLTATGRQVKISVTNLIDKSPLGGVNIKIADVTAKTDTTGNAIVVLPAGTTTAKASLSLQGYNTASFDIKVSNDTIQNNPVSLTPAGQVYFLSKLSGKIDVVKTNLDGTNRQTVLAGTGNEDDQGTVLLASRDWKYLALLSRRAGSNPTLYLINTADDSLTTMDEGSADFSLSGWVDGNFVYTVTRNDVQLWQNSRQALKSYNAASKKLTVLDQTTGTGTGNFDYVSQLIGDVYAYNGQVFYIENWTGGYSGPADLSGKQATFNSINPDGSAKKAIHSFGLASGASSQDVTVNTQVTSPGQVEFQFYDGTQTVFYQYANGQVKADTNQTNENFYSQHSTYLQSPSGNNTFWSEPRDGKNTLFIGDEDGGSPKQIATLSDYTTYGWYTDNYLLVSKNSSELYIMDKSGKQTPIKISDYHKPAQSFNGYGGGYGGL